MSVSEELAKVRAARAQRAAEEEKRDAEEREKRALADEIAIDAAEQKHGSKGIAVVHTECGVVIVRRPARVVFQRFVDSKAASVADLEKFCRASLEHPSPAEFESILDAYPGVLARVADAAATLAGVALDATRGK